MKEEKLNLSDQIAGVDRIPIAAPEANKAGVNRIPVPEHVAHKAGANQIPIAVDVAGKAGANQIPIAVDVAGKAGANQLPITAAEADQAFKTKDADAGQKSQEVDKKVVGLMTPSQNLAGKVTMMLSKGSNQARQKRNFNDGKLPESFRSKSSIKLIEKLSDSKMTSSVGKGQSLSMSI
jgi:hypothetical protein